MRFRNHARNKVGSVLSSHFKNLSTSFLGLLLVLCNSLCVKCISSIFISIGHPRNYSTHTIKNYRKSYRNFDIYPNIVSITYRNKNPDIAHSLIQRKEGKLIMSHSVGWIIVYPGLETEAINTNQQIHSALQRANLV